MTRTAHESVKLLFSYSHKDERWREQLQEHLFILKWQGLIEDWHDRKIIPGQEWEDVIDENLENSRIILFLVSPSFVASFYCYKIEMERALDKHERGEARVIPIIVRPTHWEGAPFDLLQVLPKDAKPVTTWRHKDDAWLDVVRGIRKAVEELTSKPSEHEQEADELTDCMEQVGHGDFTDHTEHTSLRRYRECVEWVWADEQLHEREVERLKDLANNKLGLSPSTAADIEREIMGDTKEAIVERQERVAKEEYRKAYPKAEETSPESEQDAEPNGETETIEAAGATGRTEKLDVSLPEAKESGAGIQITEGDVGENLATILRQAAPRLREAGLPIELAERMERLAGQVHQRCVLAVVGQIKVGKSTFVNALLGQNLAKVGTTETTATTNYFTYGEPPDPDRPVRCYWRGGKTTYEDQAFLDSLQGNDIETLRRAEGIDHLEYFLRHPFLHQVTLVDTPGTNAVLAEHHDWTVEFMQLHDQLRERHNEDTKRLAHEADAVIYLTGAVPMGSEDFLEEKDFLEELSQTKNFPEEFTQTTGGRLRALNAIGVMSNIELHPAVLAERHALSRNIADQLKDELHTVVPVGSGVQRSLDSLLSDDRAGLRRMMDELRRIPPEKFNEILKFDQRFLGREYADCPVSAGERKALFEELPEDVRRWPIFATIASVAADRELKTLDEVEVRLKEISNFQYLKEIITKRFIERSHILRWYRIASDAQEVLTQIRFTYLPKLRQEMRQEKDRLDRFLSLIRRPGGDPTTRGGLEDFFVRRHQDANRRVGELKTLHENLEAEFDALFQQLLGYDDDFEALQMLEGSEHRFSEAELEELRPLLGLHGGVVETRLRAQVDAEYVIERQLYWQWRMKQAPFGSVRQIVAERAFTRYGIIWAELNERPGA